MVKILLGGCLANLLLRPGRIFHPTFHPSLNFVILRDIAWRGAMLCRRESYLARPLSKHPDILWDQHEGSSFGEDQVQAAGAKTFAQRLHCPRRWNGARTVEQKLLERKSFGDGTREEEELQLELSQFVRNDVNSLVEKYMDYGVKETIKAGKIMLILLYKSNSFLL